MQILRVFHAKRLLWCLGLLGVLAFSSGCDSGSPTAQVEAAKGGEKGASEKEARLKGLGTIGMPKSELPKK